MNRFHPSRLVLVTTRILWAAVPALLLVLLAACGAATIDSYPAATLDANPTAPAGPDYTALSREALAARLDIPPESITVASVTEPQTSGGVPEIVLLADGQSYTFHGRDGEALLVSEPLPLAATSETPPPEPTDPLAGSRWFLTELAGEAAVPGAPATLVFGTDGYAAGETGCNEYGGPYTAVAGQIHFGALEASLMDCGSGDILAQERDLLNALAEAESYELQGDALRIRYPGGTLRFTRLEGLEATVPAQVTPSSEVARPSADVVLALEEMGTAVAIPTEPEPAADLFSVPGQQFYVDGDPLIIYEYETAAEAEADAARVSESGYGIEPPPGTEPLGPTILDWTAPPHFYRWDNLIVLYLGSNEATMAALAEIAGPPFAGEGV